MYLFHLLLPRNNRNFLAAEIFFKKGKVVHPVFERVKTIEHDNPEFTTDGWFNAQPSATIRIASKTLILSQPSSTLLVYLLGVLTISAGLYFFQIRGNEISRIMWGVSLVLWGVGAILAGTSHQAFGYQIKCRGRKAVAWTSWWELIYLIFQQVSLNVMLVAVAYSCTSGVWLKVLTGYAIVSSLIYGLLIVVGGLVPIRSLITFEFMVLTSTPIVVLFFALNGWRYLMFKSPMDLALLTTWTLMLLSMVFYWIYDYLGIARKLWTGKNRIWFSENDVLHVVLIVWVVYIVMFLVKYIEDYSVPGLS